MKMKLFKSIIFLLPIIIFLTYLLYGSLFLPIDYFTFRPWEALIVYKNNNLLTGPFYPNMHIDKISYGDTIREGNLAQTRREEWFTDRYGFRKKETDNQKWDVVIIGDSLAAGSSLTQEDTFSETLERKLGISVYPFAPSDINHYLADERFQKNPPKIVILESAEKAFPYIVSPYIDTYPNIAKQMYFINRYGPNKYISSIAIIFDKLKKNTFINFVYKKINDFNKRGLNYLFNNYVDLNDFRYKEYNLSTDKSMAFSLANHFIDWPTETILDPIKRLEKYKEVLSKTNTELLILVVPDKQTTYYNIAENGQKTKNMHEFAELARKSDLELIGVERLFQKSLSEQPDKLLFHPDDSHWTPYAVEITSDLIIEKIKDLGILK